MRASLFHKQGLNGHCVLFMDHHSTNQSGFAIFVVYETTPFRRAIVLA
jgi:hypothetical protein